MRVGEKLQGEQVRALLAALLLIIGVRLGIDLISRPDDLYSIVVMSSGT